MRSQHVLTVSVPLPSILPPHLVLAALQTYTPTLRHNRSINQYHEIPSDPNYTAGDPFSPPWDGSGRTFYVYELTELWSGIKRRAEYPVVFQSTPSGAWSRVKTPLGINVWCEWTVRPRAQSQSSTPSESTPNFMTNLADEWELYDTIVIEGNMLFMPFALQYTQRVHQEVCEKVIDEVFKNYVNEAIPP
ncbi:hypothetical protein AUP68_07288 [Ilyonectria robusta]